MVSENPDAALPLWYRIESHLRHMTDGRWHDDCKWCLHRRRYGGTGVTDAEQREADREREATR